MVCRVYTYLRKKNIKQDVRKNVSIHVITVRMVPHGP